jgi:hypothetical protein
MLPTEFQLRPEHLLHGDLADLPVANFNSELASVDGNELSFEVLAAIRGSNRYSYRFPDNSREITFRRELSFHSQGTYFERVTLFRHNLLLVEQLADPLRDQLAVGVSDAFGFVDEDTQEASLASPAELNVGDLDAGGPSRIGAQLGDPVDQLIVLYCTHGYSQ